MTDSISNQLTDLSRRTRSDLHQIWRELFNTVPHPRIARRLLVQVIAYRLQEQAYGGLSSRTERRIQQAARDLEAHREISKAISAANRPGTRLLREWGQEVHAVTIEAKGYLYRDKAYASLSAIAREITGARWSGPRFFGLNAPRRSATTNSELR